MVKTKRNETFQHASNPTKRAVVVPNENECARNVQKPAGSLNLCAFVNNKKKQAVGNDVSRRDIKERDQKV